MDAARPGPATEAFQATVVDGDDEDARIDGQRGEVAQAVVEQVVQRQAAAQRKQGGERKEQQADQQPFAHQAAEQPLRLAGLVLAVERLHRRGPGALSGTAASRVVENVVYAGLALQSVVVEGREADVVEGRLESAETDFRGARETLLLDAQEVRIAGYLGTVALGAVQRAR